MNTRDASDAPLRVLVGMPLADRLGGAERLLENVLPHALEAGIEPHVVFFEHGPLATALGANGIRTTVIPVARPNDPLLAVRTVARLRRLIARDDPEVVLAWLPRAHTWLAPAAVLAGRADRLVWWQHHISRGERLETVATLLPARRVIATSDAAAAAQRARRPRRSCTVIRPGIDLPAPPAASALADLRARLGIPAGRAIVGIAGRLVRWKGHQRFVEALARLQRSGRDVAGLVVGGVAYGIDTDLPERLRRQVAAAGLADRVVFTGHVEDPLEHIALMDVLVSATAGEPFGLTLVEAMGLGTPVVAVGHAGPAEVVVPGESGVLVPDGRPESLAAGVAALLDDDELRERVCAGGRRRVEERFTADRMAADMANALRTVARAAPA
jgi:glycosyltransferase involved in cell wall biosynthesis